MVINIARQNLVNDQANKGGLNAFYVALQSDVVQVPTPNATTGKIESVITFQPEKNFEKWYMIRQSGSYDAQSMTDTAADGYTHTITFQIPSWADLLIEKAKAFNNKKVVCLATVGNQTFVVGSTERTKCRLKIGFTSGTANTDRRIATVTVQYGDVYGLMDYSDIFGGGGSGSDIIIPTLARAELDVNNEAQVIITHNAGFAPDFYAIDSNGIEVMITPVTPAPYNQTTIDFTPNFTGKIYWH